MGAARLAFVAFILTVAGVLAGVLHGGPTNSAGEGSLPPITQRGGVTPTASEAAPKSGLHLVGDLDLAAVAPATNNDIELSNSQLREIVASQTTGITTTGDIVVGESVRVEIIHDLSSDDVRARVSELGGEIYGEVPPTLAEALVPISRLVELEAGPGIQYLRPPTRVDIPIDPPATGDNLISPQGWSGFLGQEVAKTNADTWHNAGLTGQGVKVGIIDLFDQDAWNVAQNAGEVPTPAGTFCRYVGSNCDVWFVGERHGNAVAEIIHEVAPSAQIYIAYARSASDLQAAVDYFAAQGVDIISRSLTSEFDGPGDGTGPMADVINSAVGKGITWVNSAGNNANPTGSLGSYWRGSWSDPDQDGWLNFKGADEVFGFYCGFFNGVRWNDWAFNPTDYDVYIFDTVFSLFSEASSLNNQQGGFPPLEFAGAPLPCSGVNDVDYMMIKLSQPGNGTGGDIIELMGNGTGFEYSQNPYSAAGPASDSNSSGMISVGAVDPPTGTTIAGYSSWGPTNDGRAKPDLSAAACVSSFSYYPGCFNGTSAATPVVSGAAALVLGAGLANSPSQLKTYLLNASVDRGASGPDNVYGKGELRLPDPPLAPTPTLPPTATSTPTAGPTLTSTPTAGPTSSSTPTTPVTSSPTPTSTQPAGSFLWGDVNCSGASNPVDSLWLLRFDAGLPLNIPAGCPPPGQIVNVGTLSVAWGDANCASGVNPVDSLTLLRNDAGLSVNQGAGCPQIGKAIFLGPASPTPGQTAGPSATTSVTPISTPAPTVFAWNADNFAWYENAPGVQGFSECNLAKPVPPSDPSQLGLCAVFDLDIPEGYYDEHYVLRRNGVVVADELYADSYSYAGDGWHKSFPPPADPGAYTLQVFMDDILIGESSVNVSAPVSTTTPTPTSGPTPPPGWASSEFTWYKNIVPLGPASECDYAKPVPPNSPEDSGLCVDFYLEIPSGTYDIRFRLERNSSVVVDFEHPNIPLDADYWSQSFPPPAPTGTYELFVFIDGLVVGQSSLVLGNGTPVPTSSASPTPTPTPGGDPWDCITLDPTIPIPDNDQDGADVFFDPTGSETIADLDICLNLVHGWVGDLVITLTHVDTGTSITLFDFAECHGEDLFVYFDDEAATSAGSACSDGQPALQGAYRPLESLSAFDGETWGGDWTLNVADVETPDDGEVLGSTLWVEFE